MRVWFSGRMRPCQGRDGSSILPTRTRQVFSKTLRIYKGNTKDSPIKLGEYVDNYGDYVYKTVKIWPIFVSDYFSDTFHVKILI